MNKTSFRFMRLARFAIPMAFLSLAACSSSGDSGGGQSNCDAVEIIPAIVTVVSATGAPIACDATFSVLDAPDAGAGSSAPTIGACATDVAGCPANPTNGATVPCAYYLDGYASTGGGSYTLQVSQAGFASQVVTGITTGVGGCATEGAASHTTVTLVAEIADGGTD
jgi:hypothetical protein